MPKNLSTKFCNMSMVVMGRGGNRVHRPTWRRCRRRAGGASAPQSEELERTAPSPLPVCALASFRAGRLRERGAHASSERVVTNIPQPAIRARGRSCRGARERTAHPLPTRLRSGGRTARSPVRDEERRDRHAVESVADAGCAARCSTGLKNSGGPPGAITIARGMNVMRPVAVALEALAPDFEKNRDLRDPPKRDQ
jgi:hypothetical protein